MRRLLLSALLAAGSGCGTEPPPPPPEVDPATAVAQAEALAAAAQRQAAEAAAQQQAEAGVQVGEGTIEGEPPVQVVLVWQGIGALHKGFFSDPALTTQLSVDLAGTVVAPANIYVRYDSAEFTGSLRLQLLPDSLRLPVATGQDTVALQALAPITRALAGYRSGVAGRYDVRVESFAVGIEAFRGPHGCVFEVAGAPPPDGSVVSPCVLVDGQRRCGEPTAEGVRFEAEVARTIRRCLDL